MTICRLLGTALFLATTAAAPLAAQTVLTGDHSVQGSLCAGDDCTGSESFLGIFAAKLKSATPSLLFEDTDTLAPDAGRDWALLINDNLLEEFIVYDVDSNFKSLVIEGDSRENALYVNAFGNVGFGTSLPQGSLHLMASQTPGIIMERDGATGGTPYSWSIGGDAVGFGISDSSNTLAPLFPFAIGPGASTGALLVNGDGNVGVGVDDVLTEGNLWAKFHVMGDVLVEPTDTDTAKDASALMHLRAADGTGKLLVEEIAGTGAPRTLMELKNNGRPEIVLANTATGGEWSFGAGTNFILKQGAVGSSSAAKTKLFQVNANGDAIVQGTLTTSGGTCGGGCDAVFTENRVIPAAEYHAQMWDQGHLPHVGPTVENAPINISEKLGGILNAVEHAHVHNATQEDRLAALEAENAALRAEMADLRALLTTR